MIRKQIYLTPEIDRELNILARQQGKSMAEIVRDILEKRLKISERPKNTVEGFLNRITGIGKKGPHDLSTNLFNYLYGDKSPNYGKHKKITRRR
ncbi:CopG family transcriptional regulator [Candidatus Daviesbacteria bacterium]|nr:CopG family transcriptional regulator [Candidatus Daviesbacteria bacterium]